jgi:N-acetylglucosamine kinase
LEASHQTPGNVSLVTAGLAGVDFDGVGKAEMRELFKDLGYASTLIEGDMVMAHAGALAGKPGVLALAGTGSSVLGIGPKGDRVKVGGWGPLYGDEGSAHRIGQAALRAAARDFDGRGPKTGITQAIVDELGLRSFRESVEAIYVKRLEPREIAQLCKTANEIAEAGDEVARRILETAGSELAECVAAAAVQLGGSERMKVSYEGSVITSCKLMRDSFCKYLATQLPSATVVAPQFSPVVGAYLLGRAKLGLDNDDRMRAKLTEARSNKLNVRS